MLTTTVPLLTDKLTQECKFLLLSNPMTLQTRFDCLFYMFVDIGSGYEWVDGFLENQIEASDYNLSLIDNSDLQFLMQRHIGASNESEITKEVLFEFTYRKLIETNIDYVAQDISTFSRNHSRVSLNDFFDKYNEQFSALNTFPKDINESYSKGIIQFVDFILGKMVIETQYQDMYDHLVEIKYRIRGYY